MSVRAFDDLHTTLRRVETRPLFVMQLNVRQLHVVGQTSGALRRVGVISAGEFKGDRLEGRVLDGGSDWQDVRRDGATTLDVRLVLETSERVLIAMTYRGIRHGPADVIERIERGEVVDPT